MIDGAWAPALRVCIRYCDNVVHLLQASVNCQSSANTNGNQRQTTNAGHSHPGHSNPPSFASDPGAASRLEATVRKTQPHVASCSGDRPWPTEHWPRICLEEGSYSWRLAAHCGHSNAPAEYAIKRKKKSFATPKNRKPRVMSAVQSPDHTVHSDHWSTAWTL